MYYSSRSGKIQQTHSFFLLLFSYSQITNECAFCPFARTFVPQLAGFYLFLSNNNKVGNWNLVYVQESRQH